MQVRGLESAARPVGVQLHVLEVRSGDDFAGAFRAAMPAHPDAVIALSSPHVSNHSQHLAALAVTHHLPAMTLFPSFARGEGLMAYGPDTTDIFRQVARLVAKILHGATPADLPIERPMQFKLVINLGTHLRRDTICHHGLRPLKLQLSSGGHSGCFCVTTVVLQLSRLKRIAINLKTAQALGLTIPPTQGDRI
jgi:hypothetical protein